LNGFMWKNQKIGAQYWALLGEKAERRIAAQEMVLSFLLLQPVDFPDNTVQGADCTVDIDCIVDVRFRYVADFHRLCHSLLYRSISHLIRWMKKRVGE
jgi:hypothetical protein